MSEHKIVVKRVSGDWVLGTVDDMEFEAKVYDEGSKFGIDAGRVSKLAVYRTKARGEIIAYERGWDRYPRSPKHEEVLDALTRFCESLPKQSTWRKTFHERVHRFLVTDDFVLEYDENGNPC